MINHLTYSFNTSLTPNLSPDPSPADARLEQYEHIVKATIPDCTHITIDYSYSANNIPRASLIQITLPLLFLLRTNDLPERFIVTGPEDLRLLSDDFLQEFANFASDFFRQSRKELSAWKKMCIRGFLLFIRDPILSEEARNFVIHHEMAHLHYKHALVRPARPRLIVTSLIGVTAALCYFIASAIGSIIVLSLATIIATFVLFTFIQYGYWSYHSRKHEKQADLWAAKTAPQSLKGAIFMMKSFKELGKIERKLSWISRVLFSPSGDWRFYYASHPSFTARIHYLSAYQKQHQLNQTSKA